MVLLNCFKEEYMEVKEEMFDKALGGTGIKYDLIKPVLESADSIEKQLKLIIDAIFLGKDESSLCWSEKQKQELQEIMNDFGRARMAIIRAKGLIVEFKANVAEDSHKQLAEDWENGIN